MYISKAIESISTSARINIRLSQRMYSNGSNDRGQPYNGLSVAIVN